MVLIARERHTFKIVQLSWGIDLIGEIKLKRLVDRVRVGVAKATCRYFS